MFGSVAYAQAAFASSAGNTFQAVVSESATALAQFAAAATFSASFSGAASSVDAVASSFLVQAQTLETAAGLDTTVASFLVKTNISEAAAIASSPSANASFPVSISDASSSLALFSSVPNYAVSVQETTSSVFSTASTPTYSANVNLTTSSADETVCTFAFLSFINETTDAVDTINTQLLYPVSVSEAAVLTESPVSASVNFVVSFSAHAQAAAAFVVSSNFACTVIETGTAQDIFFGRFLWNDIDDTQVPVWTDILRPRIIEDIDVFGGSNFGVASYTASIRQSYNPNPVIWNPIDDQQNPNWTDVPTV